MAPVYEHEEEEGEEEEEEEEGEGGDNESDMDSRAPQGKRFLNGRISPGFSEDRSRRAEEEDEDSYLSEGEGPTSVAGGLSLAHASVEVEDSRSWAGRVSPSSTGVSTHSFAGRGPRGLHSDTRTSSPSVRTSTSVEAVSSVAPSLTEAQKAYRRFVSSERQRIGYEVDILFALVVAALRHVEQRLSARFICSPLHRSSTSSPAGAPSMQSPSPKPSRFDSSSDMRSHSPNPSRSTPPPPPRGGAGRVVRRVSALPTSDVSPQVRGSAAATRRTTMGNFSPPHAAGGDTSPFLSPTPASRTTPPQQPSNLPLPSPAPTMLLQDPLLCQAARSDLFRFTVMREGFQCRSREKADGVWEVEVYVDGIPRPATGVER